VGFGEGIEKVGLEYMGKSMPNGEVKKAFTVE
jgi:hypothetical protein